MTTKQETRPLKSQRTDSAELLAGEAIRTYYGALRRISQRQQLARAAGLARENPQGCVGVTLDDCFGGDLWCAWRATMCNGREYDPARRRLLATLDAIGQVFPHNGYVIGQRVDVAIKNHEWQRAWDASEACSAAAWWCQALRGYVLEERSLGAGEAALDSALAGAPTGELAFGTKPVPYVADRGLRCEWSDVGYLLSHELLNEYAKEPCGQDRDFIRRFWWLADPMWSIAGNERRAAHLERQLRMRLMYDFERWIGDTVETASAPRPFWPQALHREWTRNGFYNSWRWQAVGPLREEGQDSAPQLYVNGGYSFVPNAARFRHPMASEALDWEVRWSDGPERLIVPETWHNLEQYQLAVLLRGNRQHIVAAARLPVVVSSLKEVTAALSMGRPSDLRTEVKQATLESTGVVRSALDVQTGEWLASIEMSGQGWRARARFAAPAPELVEGFGISVPVLVAAQSPLASSDIERMMLPSQIVRRGTLGIYCEVYGVAEGTVVQASLSLKGTGRSVLNRLAAALGLSSDTSVGVSWSEIAEALPSGSSPLYSTVDLGNVDEGKYELELQVGLPSGRVAVASRMIEVVP